MSEINKILRLPAVKELTGLSTTSIWRQEKLGKFPKRVHIGQRAVGWLASGINQWIENRINKEIGHANQ